MRSFHGCTSKTVINGYSIYIVEIGGPRLGRRDGSEGVARAGRWSESLSREEVIGIGQEASSRRNCYGITVCLGLRCASPYATSMRCEARIADPPAETVCAWRSA